jgi:hypothetical protein
MRAKDAHEVAAASVATQRPAHRPITNPDTNAVRDSYQLSKHEREAERRLRRPDMVERWRRVVGFSKYEVSDQARVRRISTGKILRPTLIRGRYPYVSLRRDGVTIKRLVYRLRAAAFGGLRKGFQIDHRRAGIAASRAEILRGAKGHEHASSTYKGVSFIKARRRWYACIKDNGRTRGLGLFADEAMAARIYDRAAFAAWGKWAFQNFPR